MNRKADFFTKRIDSNRFESRIGMLYSLRFHSLQVLGRPVATHLRRRPIVAHVRSALLTTLHVPLSSLAYAEINGWWRSAYSLDGKKLVFPQFFIESIRWSGLSVLGVSRNIDAVNASILATFGLFRCKRFDDSFFLNFNLLVYAYT